MTPSVPSEPTKRRVRSYPAEDFFALVAVVIISPSAVTTFKATTLSFIVPAHRVGAGGAGRRHAADRGVGARIDRKEQARVAQVLVERLSRDARLDDAIEILGVNFDDAVHPRKVDRNAAVRRIEMAFQ